MATDNPRFSVTFSNESFEKIQKYKASNNISTQSKAVAQLVKIALDKMDSAGGTKKAPSVSDEAMQIAKDFQALDKWGKQVVRSVIRDERERMEDEERFFADTELTREPKIINLFDNPSAAGPLLGETGQGCQPYELTAEDPQGAAYAIRVQGDSMAPYFPDGSIAFVNHDEMRDGDIGIFCVDGATVIKQLHYDRQLGITYLFSLNRQRDDCDVVITRSSGRSVVWQGRVITKQRFELPGM